VACPQGSESVHIEPFGKRCVAKPPRRDVI
jgi:hypothetical protein